jgi:hypothetical protein
MPENADEFLLTDDGEGEHKDTIEELARGEGNDVLTLTADIANKLGVSKGTVDTFDDLIFQLGLSRNYTLVNKKQSDQIMKTWRDGLESARQQLPRLWHDYNEVQPKSPGQYQQRTQARGKQLAILNEMIALLRKYEEAINPRALRVPDISTIEALKKRIELQQTADKPEKK